MPAIWAVALALVMTRFGWELPGPLDKSVRLLGQGTIAVFLVMRCSRPRCWAVICIILATEYEAEPQLVTSVVFFSTLLSLLTLTPLLALLT